MNKISSIVHCTDNKHILPILRDGYLRSISDLKGNPNYDEADTKKIYTRIHFNNDIFNNRHGNICFLLDKSILKERKDYFVNLSAYYGKKIHSTTMYNDISEDFINFLFEEEYNMNEVIFKNKISLKKYLIGVLFKYNKIKKIGIRYDKLYELGVEKYIKWFRITDIDKEKEIRDVFKIFLYLEEKNIPIYFIQDNTFFRIDDF